MDDLTPGWWGRPAGGRAVPNVTSLLPPLEQGRWGSEAGGELAQLQFTPAQLAGSYVLDDGLHPGELSGSHGDHVFRLQEHHSRQMELLRQFLPPRDLGDLGLDGGGSL